MVLWITVRVLIRHSSLDPLRNSALALLAIAMLQVFLGIAAYMSRIATIDAPQPMPLMVGFTVAHVAVGALTMAASVVLGVAIFRYAGAYWARGIDAVGRSAVRSEERP